jgi:hypothetical protein
MTCPEYKDLMMGYLDDELDDQQLKKFQAHLKGCSECSGELAEFKKLKEITDEVTLVEPEDRIWDQYWSNVYNRLERGTGWIVFSVAAILLVIYCGFKLIEEVIADPAVGMMLKVGLLTLIAGTAILFVSAARERLYFWRKDRYKDVRR